MQIPKIQITPKKYNEETTVISMRMPKDMLRDIDAVATQTGRTRNEILMLSMEFALDNIEIIDKNRN
jgi:predicted DNA-binding protein